ncbi:hypothetical protein FOMPIDRAFT_1047873 [Fomitopsis schrenkii]|uniref:Uncharacterized protein n=1 Tax=Fomitopsis schrenkii TaxID=2126942 RepID=S8FMH1_FOMSC|nr:hypothetical protein FOMPIDRAFT_1047873 [Fomitopsis schrenkii]
MPAPAIAALSSALAGLGLSSPAVARMCSVVEHNREARKVSGRCTSGAISVDASALPSPSAEVIVYPHGKARARNASVVRTEVSDEYEEGYVAGCKSDPDALARTHHLRSKRTRAPIEGVPGNTACVGLGLGLPVAAGVAPTPPTYATEVRVDDVHTSPTTAFESEQNVPLYRPPAGRTRKWDSWPPLAPSPSLLPSPTLVFGPPLTGTFSSSPAWPPVSMAPSPSMLPSPRLVFMGTPRRPAWPPVAPSPSMLPAPVF